MTTQLIWEAATVELPPRSIVYIDPRDGMYEIRIQGKYILAARIEVKLSNGALLYQMGKARIRTGDSPTTLYYREGVVSIPL